MALILRACAQQMRKAAATILQARAQQMCHRTQTHRCAVVDMMWDVGGRLVVGVKSASIARLPPKSSFPADEDELMEQTRLDNQRDLDRCRSLLVEMEDTEL